MAAMSLPPGFRFHPTDDELVAYYLHRKINGLTIELEIIPEVDLYKCEPWDLPDKSYIPSKDMEWYFYSPRDRKYPNGSRTNRATKAGYWKATGKDRLVHSHKRPVGMKKTLVYYRGRAPHGIRSNWVMHEYRLLEKLSSSSASTSLKDSYALCRVFKKTITMPKNKEEAQTGNVENESSWVCGEQNNAGESEGREAKDENFNVQCCSMFPSDTSSDLTQGTCTPAETCIVEDHMQPPFVKSDEANSSANLYSLGVDCSSTLIQDIESFTSLLHHQFAYPPLDMEDFPQINIAETGKGSKSEIMEDLVMYHHDTNGALEEIFSLCSSQENNSTAL